MYRSDIFNKGVWFTEIDNRYRILIIIIFILITIMLYSTDNVIRLFWLLLMTKLLNKATDILVKFVLNITDNQIGHLPDTERNWPALCNYAREKWIYFYVYISVLNANYFLVILYMYLTETDWAIPVFRLLPESYETNPQSHILFFF
jgi:hypothetical protein